MSAIEGEEGRQDLEKRLARGREVLDIESEIIDVNSSDFSKVDETSIIKQIQDAN